MKKLLFVLILFLLCGCGSRQSVLIVYKNDDINKDKPYYVSVRNNIDSILKDLNKDIFDVDTITEVDNKDNHFIEYEIKLKSNYYISGYAWTYKKYEYIGVDKITKRYKDIIGYTYRDTYTYIYNAQVLKIDGSLDYTYRHEEHSDFLNDNLENLNDVTNESWAILSNDNDVSKIIEIYEFNNITQNEYKLISFAKIIFWVIFIISALFLIINLILRK